MRVTFLGTGSGDPIPEPWCRCSSCQSARINGGKDVRFRSAALINDDLLIDAGPDLAASAARLGIDLTTVQAVLITHPHSDHLALDAFRRRGREWGGTPLPSLRVFASKAALAVLTRPDPFLRPDGTLLSLAPWRMDPRPITQFDHFFIETGGSDSDSRLPEGQRDVPEMPRRIYEVWTVAANHFEKVGNPQRQEPMLFIIRQLAGQGAEEQALPPTLFYATDTDSFLPETWTALDRLVIEGVRFNITVVDGTYGNMIEAQKHMTMMRMLDHQSEMQRRNMTAPNAIRLTTHLHHRGNPPHDQLVTLLAPHGVAPAYDGMIVNV